MKNFSTETLHTLVCPAPVRCEEWIALLAQDCALRIGSGPTVYGCHVVRPLLERFLHRVVGFGAAGCDVLSERGHWIAETDIEMCGRARHPAVPCVVSVRTDGHLIRDLRFYLDLTEP